MMQTFTGTTGAWRSRSVRRNRSMTIFVIEKAICGPLVKARSMTLRVTLTMDESRSAMIDADRGSPVNSASSRWFRRDRFRRGSSFHPSHFRSPHGGGRTEQSKHRHSVHSAETTSLRKEDQCIRLVTELFPGFRHCPTRSGFARLSEAILVFVDYRYSDSTSKCRPPTFCAALLFLTAVLRLLVACQIAGKSAIMRAAYNFIGTDSLERRFCGLCNGHNPRQGS